MIQKLIINNFQSHKHTEIEFDPGMNVIIGTSDHGKSAILRSLRFVKDNRPSGDSIRSWWGGETSVEVITDEGSAKRIKDKIEEYIVNNTSFKAFKTDVPAEVTQLLRMDDINLQRQLDSHFLLSKTPGEVAAHFNKIAKFDAIDRGTSNVKSKITEINQDIKHKEVDKKKKEEELAGFEWLDEFEAKVEVLEGMQASLSSLENRKRRLSDLLKSIDTINTKIKEKSEILKAEKKVTALLELFREKQGTSKEIGKILEKTIDIKIIDNKLEKNKTILVAEPITLAILDLYNQQTTLQTKINTLDKLLDKVSTADKDLLKSQVKADALEKEYHDNYPDVCPFCNSIIKK